MNARVSLAPLSSVALNTTVPPASTMSMSSAIPSMLCFGGRGSGFVAEAETVWVSDGTRTVGAS